MNDNYESPLANSKYENFLAPLNSEKLLIETELPFDFDRALVVSPGRAQFAEHATKIHPQGRIDCWYLDLHNSQLVSDRFQGQGNHQSLNVICSPDLPEQTYQLVAMPILKRSEGELTRDLMQQAYQRLSEGGLLAMAVDNPNDSWLLQQLKALSGSIQVQRNKTGTVYLAKKRGDLKRVRNFRCQFAFRDQGRLIQAISEPGVFSHRRLDPGSRQLLNMCGIDEGDRVLDLGCGSGGIALAAGFSTSAEVTGVDCNARAIRCLQAGAEINGLTNISGLLDASGDLGDREFEIVLANPPYFGNHQISQHFVDTASRHLVPGGALLLVTKQPSWFENYMGSEFEDFEVVPSGNYHVVCGRKP